MFRAGLLCCLMVLAAVAVGAETTPGSYWYAVDHITSAADDARILVWATLPPDWHGQEVTIGEIVPEPVAILEDTATGNRIVEWMVEPGGGEVPPLNTFFHYDFDVTESPVRQEIDPAAVGPYDIGSEFYKRYTAAETWIQTTGPVLDRARAIVGSESHPWHRVEALYDWVVANLVFDAPGLKERDAESVLEAGGGDCEQFSVLMTAMCRSLGIPARTVTNAWTTGGDHVFLEVWLEGYGWVPADPSLGQMLGEDGGGFASADVERIMTARNVPVGNPRWLLGNLFDGRLVVTVGNNITFESPTLGRRVTLQGMRLGETPGRPAGFLIEGLNRDTVHGGFLVFGERLADDEAAHTETHQRLAGRFFDVGRHDIVEDVCRESIAQSGEGVMAWLNMGRVYLHKGEYYKAEAAFKRALTTDTTKRVEKLEAMIWAHNYLGHCYDLLGARDLAMAEYQKVVDYGNNFRGAIDYANRYLEKPFTKEKAGRM